ncbi:MAG: MoxR family ATPase [Archaeoglobaceae archaeon]
MRAEEFKEKSHKIIDEVTSIYVGSENHIAKLLATCLSNGNVLFEDYPGLGKTILAKVFARTIGADYGRVQFTPDLLPSDITGTKVWRANEGRFVLVRGPVFTNVLLADEINRSPPKTQAALLEAMEERQVTIEGDTHRLLEPFFVIATQNPIEQEGTYPLPEAQMDRFMLKMSPGYPVNIDSEVSILKRRIEWKKDDPTGDIIPIISIEEFREMQKFVENIHVSESIIRYIANLIRATRKHELVEIGSSPRGGLALLKVSRAMAAINGRDFVIPDDIKTVASDALSHRVLLDVEYVIEGERPENIVEEVLKNVEVPKDLTT